MMDSADSCISNGWYIYISADDIYQINSNIFIYQIDSKHR